MGVLKGIFTTVFNMSVTASIAILLVLCMRFIIRKAPKWVSYLLWAVVGFRLICPYSLPSSLSVFNLEFFQKHAVADDKVVWDFTASDYGISVDQSRQYEDVPSGNTGASETGRNTAAGSQVVQPAEGGENIADTNGSERPDVQGALALVWLAGMGCFGVYELVSYYRLKRRVSQAVRSAADVYECDTIDVPFVIGIMHPRIYLPFRVDQREREYILLHERYHIKRKDYLIKTGALLLLILHWFNPLVWAAYHFMSADMEMSCDEKVIQKVGQTLKCSYSNSLLAFAAPRKVMPAGRLAFGESSVKTRIKNVLGFEKPGKAVLGAAVGVCIFAAFLIAGNARQKNVIRYDGNEADGGLLFSYSVDGNIKSFLLYREVYEGGELKDYKMISSGVFGDDKDRVKRRGKVRIERSFRKEDGNMEGGLKWEIDGKGGSDSVELGRYGFHAAVDSYLLDDETKHREFQPEEDFVLTAWHLGYTGHQPQEFPCSEFDQRTRSKLVWNANSGEVLYRIVVSELEVGALRGKYEVPYSVRELYEARNPYIGDASANGKLLELLNVGGLGAYTTELQTNEEPYILTVHFIDQPKDQAVFNRTMKQKAVMLLALIENAGEVRWTYPVAKGQGETTYRWKLDRQEAEANLGIDSIKEYGETTETLEKLQDISLSSGERYEGITTSGGKYIAPDGRRYQYAKYLFGMLPNAEFASSYYVLTNDEDLTFDDVAWSMLSSTMEDKLDFYWVHEQD